MAVCSCCGHRCHGRYDKRPCLARDLSVAGWRIYVKFERWRVYCPRCRAVFVERLDWLAENPRYTQRFAMHIGALCREMTNKAVSEIERLHDSTVKNLDKIYMRKQVAWAEVHTIDPRKSLWPKAFHGIEISVTVYATLTPMSSKALA
jgi:transposase